MASSDKDLFEELCNDYHHCGTDRKEPADRIEQATLELSSRLDAYSAILAQTPPFLLIESNRDCVYAMSASVLRVLCTCLRLKRCSFVQLTESM